MMESPSPAPPRRRKSILDVGRSIILGLSPNPLRRSPAGSTGDDADFETGGISPAEVAEKARKRRFVNLNFERSLSLDERTLKNQQSKMRSRQGRPSFSPPFFSPLDVVLMRILESIDKWMFACDCQYYFRMDVGLTVQVFLFSLCSIFGVVWRVDFVQIRGVVKTSVSYSYHGTLRLGIFLLFLPYTHFLNVHMFALTYTCYLNVVSTFNLVWYTQRYNPGSIK